VSDFPFADLPDLAAEGLGGATLLANDDFFAAKENLLKAHAAEWREHDYTDRGKWMDGWETRRRRTPGHDWCVVRLGLPGVIHTIVVDTAFFRGNFPTHCWVEGCGVPAGVDISTAEVRWHTIVPRSELAGDAQNSFAVDDRRRFTHLRLNIFPDGGVARLRVLGDPMPDWRAVLADDREIDLASAVLGAHVVDTSDRFYGEPRNMLMPYPAANMGDGWETKRRRTGGHDWAILRLAAKGVIRRIEIDTAYFKGNYPDSCSVAAAVVSDEGGVSADVASAVIGNWKTVLPEVKLQPDRLHVFDADAVEQATGSHVRLDIYPDGGVSRFRVFGVPTRDARAAAMLRLLNTLDEPEARHHLAAFCGSPVWIARMTKRRPFASVKDVYAAADAASDALSRDEWLEALRHHPRIGERKADRVQSEIAQQWSSEEQSSVDGARAADLAALADVNREYEARFGHVFLISAAGRSVPEMLSAARERLANDPQKELDVAAAEHRKIIRHRLEKLFG
jgi:allantoicase